MSSIMNPLSKFDSIIALIKNVTESNSESTL